MKKRLSSWLLVLMGLLAAQNVAAATNYDLYVGGNRVTSSNKGDIKPSTSSWKKSGTISYDPENSTLTFKNVKLEIDVATPAVQNTGIENLTIKFVGSNIIRSYGTVIYSAKNLTITGVYTYCYSATLEHNNPDNSHTGAIMWLRNGSNLTVEDIHLTLNGNKYGILGEYEYGNNPNTGTCYFETAHVKVSTKTTALASCIDHFKEIKCREKDTYFTNGRKSSNNMITDSSGNKVTSFETQNWGYVDNVIIPNFGGSDYLTLHPQNVTAGTVKWRQSDRCLFIEGVTYSLDKDFIVNHEIDEFDLLVSGTNNISTGSCKLVDTKRPVSFRGNYVDYTKNVLNATATGTYCIYSSSSGLLKFDRLVATLKSSTNPLKGSGYSSLSISDCKMTVSATGSSGAAISGFSSCTLTNDRVSTYNTCFRPAYKAFAKDGGTAATTVSINKPTTFYKVYVLGQQLTDVDRAYPGIEGLTGDVYYNPDAKKITLSTAKFNPPSSNTNPGLEVYSSAANVIEMSGTNDIYTYGNPLKVHGDMTFQGGGRLNAECKGTGSGLNVYSENSSANITFNVNNYVYIYGSNNYAGISGAGGSSNNVLYVKKAGAGSDYLFKGPNVAPITGFSNIVMTYMDYYTAGCYFDKTDMKIKTNVMGSDGKHQNLTGLVNFDEVSTEYAIWVVGRKLNNQTIRGLGSPNIEGPTTAVAYNPETKVLTLNGGKLTYGSDHVIDVRESGVTISVVGSNQTDIRQTSTSTNYYGIYMTQDLTVTGSQTLKFTNNSPKNGIMANSHKITFKNCSYVNTYFINGGSTGSTGSMVVDNSHVYSAGYVQNFSSITTQNGTAIIGPQLAKFDSSKKCVVDKSGNMCNSVLFDKLVSYGLDICGTAITNANNYDVLGNGVFEYDNSSKRLYVRGNASCSNYNVIRNNSISGLEIYFSKSSTLTGSSSNYSTIYLQGSTTFTSASSAMVKVVQSNTSSSGIGAISSKDKTIDVTFKNISNMGITSYGYGINAGNKLTFNNCYMSVQAASTVIGGFNSINFTGCKITSPSGSKVTNGNVTNSSGTVLKNRTITIEDIATGIDDVEAAPETELATPKAIYDTEGRQLQEMRNGINIVRMPDGTIRKVLKK